MFRKNGSRFSERIMLGHIDDGMIRSDRIMIEGVAP
jgi:hypothetical protein